MISFEDAKSRIKQIPFTLTSESIRVTDAGQRILSSDVIACADIPSWNNSAMDGYAVRLEDYTDSIKLPVSQIVPAGKTNLAPLEPNTCARIFTGAPIPDGADAVVIQENVSIEENGNILFTKPFKRWSNIRLQAEEIAQGTVVLKKGTVLDASGIGLCLSAGVRIVEVWKIPTIGIIGTGDELVDPQGEQTTLSLGQIWATNTLSLQQMFQETLNLPSIDCGIARDNLTSTVDIFTSAILEHQCDLIISTGGVSVGDFDVVHKALNELPNCRVDMDFWKVQMKPGKPVAIGIIHTATKQIPLFALPGNPVSALMGFLQFVRPFLLNKMEHPHPELQRINATLGCDVKKRGSRLEFVRVWLTKEDGVLQVFPTSSQSSAWMSSFCDATALLPIAPNCNFISKGSNVEIQLLPTSGKWTPSS